MAGRKPSRGKRGANLLPDSVYPGPLPLSRQAALKLLGRLGEFEATGGTFLTFVQIPLEERIGVWRFAGASRSLAGAVRRVEEFAGTMGLGDPGRPRGLLRRLLEDTAGREGDEDFYPREAPRKVRGPHRVVLCVQYGAPYEGLGAGVVEVASLAGSSFGGMAPETDRPAEWDEAFDEE